MTWFVLIWQKVWKTFKNRGPVQKSVIVISACITALLYTEAGQGNANGKGVPFLEKPTMKRFCRLQSQHPTHSSLPQLPLSILLCRHPFCVRVWDSGQCEFSFYLRDHYRSSSLLSTYCLQIFVHLCKILEWAMVPFFFSLFVFN